MVGGVAAGFFTAGFVEAQSFQHGDPQRPPPSVLEMEWMIQTLRPSGQPVIAVFDGWIPHEDGSHTLCFGYLNLNIETPVDIPLGPNNFIEPRQFDGVQPTHFRVVPGHSDYGGNQRYSCAFTVDTPPGYEGDVWWTLIQDEAVFKVPGRTTVPYYLLDDLAHSSRVGIMAPVVRPVGAPGTEGRGRANPARIGPIQGKVGVPVALEIEIVHPNAPSEAQLATTPEGDDSSSDSGNLFWGVFRTPGVGKVTFIEGTSEFSSEEAVIPWTVRQRTYTTSATFSEPGEYVLHFQAFQGSMNEHCCWTNGFVQVTVTP
jgi:hypothetical protein